MTIPTVQFHLDEAITLRDRTRLKAFLRLLFQKEKTKLAGLQYIFCSDERLLEINISVDRVRENAREFNSSVQKELHRVIFHGALHLCGYRDKTRKDESEMRKMEEKYLHLYGL